MRKRTKKTSLCIVNPYLLNQGHATVPVERVRSSLKEKANRLYTIANFLYIFGILVIGIFTVCNGYAGDFAEKVQLIIYGKSSIMVNCVAEVAFCVFGFIIGNIIMLFGAFSEHTAKMLNHEARKLKKET